MVNKRKSLGVGKAKTLLIHTYSAGTVMGNEIEVCVCVYVCVCVCVLYPIVNKNTKKDNEDNQTQ